MRVRTEHRGRHLPFERERRIILQRLPVGATITRAVITVTPQSTDPARRFLETIAFSDGAGDWGANKIATNTAVEIDLHARRKLAGLVGSDLARATLLVDLGGGFIAVNDAGGLGAGKPLPVTDTMDLPGLTVTGLRLAQATTSTKVSLLRVASPPSNVSLAIEGGPTFWTYFGDLVDPQATPDFAGILQAMLPGLEVANGHHIVAFVVRSDSIARLDLELEIEHTVAVSGLPDGVPSVQAPYAYNGSPEGAQGSLAVAVPPGMVAVVGATAGRVQGAFEATRVLHGPVGSVPAPEQPLVSGAGPLAQPFVLTAAELATSVDLLLTAVTAEVTLSVDLVDDLDGKPGRASLLPAPARLTVRRDQAPRPTWLNVPLAAEVEFGAGDRHWLVVQALTGTAAWGAAPADRAAAPALQQTRDGGLSWRAATGETGIGPLAAHLRLRHSTQAFHMPLELRVGSGAAEVAVSLQRFAAQGTVDLQLDFPEVAGAVNEALASSRPGASASAEHVANGDFTEWYRVSTEVAHAGVLEAGGDATIRQAAFGPDGATVYAAGYGMHFFAFDPFCQGRLYATQFGAGSPNAMVVDPSGRRVLIASDQDGVAALFTIADTATGRVVGTPLDSPERVVALAVSADGSAIYALGADDSGAVLRRIPWASLVEAATGGSALAFGNYPARSLDGEPRGLTVAPGGRVFAATIGVTGADSRLYAFAADLSLLGSLDVAMAGDARDVAATVSEAEVLVLGQEAFSVVRSSDLVEVFKTTLRASGIRLGIDPDGALALVLEDDVLEMFDMRRRTLAPIPGVRVFGGLGLAMSPAGTHAVVTHNRSSQATLLSIGSLQPADWELTAGGVRPWCLSATSGPLAVLGAPGGSSAISQVVPAVGGTRYRFGFDGIADVDGAVGELVWRGDDCGQLRTDRVPVTVLDFVNPGVADRLLRHELVVIAPLGATQVEIRFQTAEGMLGVDAVSLAGSSEALTDPAAQITGAATGWQPSAPSLTVTPSDAGFTVTNGGPTPAVLSQVIAAPGGQHFALRATARVGEFTPDGSAIEVVFSDESARPVGPMVRLQLDVLAFDQRAASGLVPSDAVEAEVRVVVSPGGAVELSELSLVLGVMDEVELGFVSEAPGALTVSQVVVGLDEAPPARVPVPTTGLCRATPPGSQGDGDGCYCPRCREQRPVKRVVPVVTAAGGPGSVAPCPVCGTQRVRVGGRLVASAERVAVPRFVATRVSGPVLGPPRTIVSVHVDAPLTAIQGIGAAREAELRAAGIGSVQALAEADVATVASLPGVSTRMASAFIWDAVRLVRDRGTRVLFDEGVTSRLGNGPR